ncbi:FAD/NAD(P)-binding oxidoreductase [Mesorhizobium sp.]|uniref:FAD/NAD(P)-dependent oxidoreductase n=1 Tax=Mesorhizobium sp. TaxID=1871066 RepID=UPI0012066581|nr:FAD/NAD(P)-binding oxidoreductase [Mesorhizobium sp.]TIS53132.1 MAG: FAD-binding protein [Mesorhizobium sp.]TIS86214.1 MAG: FAD-binding protein [Mesorhizobium sp.]
MRREAVIIGAGPAGMRAALTLADAGLRPLVIDEACRSGGQIYRRPPSSLRRKAEVLYGFEAKRAKALHEAFDALGDRIEYWPETVVWNVHGDRLHLLVGGQSTSISWLNLILAPGAMDRVIPFEGWTLPGVYTLGAAQIALKSQACAIGERVVLFGSGPLLYLVAWQYVAAGVDIAAVLDTARAGAGFKALPGLARGGYTFLKGVYYVAALRARGVRIISGIRPLAALSGPDAAVAGFVYRDHRGHERRIACDAIGFGYGLRSEIQLAELAGLSLAYDEVQRQWIPVGDKFGGDSGGIYLAGDGMRVRGAEIAELTGKQAALRLLANLGRNEYRSQLATIEASLHRAEAFRRALECAFPFPAHLAQELPDNVVVCRCEGVTIGALRDAVRACDVSDINRVKAFTRLGMGRCQGRVCSAAAAEIIAAAAGVRPEAVGHLRGQPPVKPVALGALAEGTAP